MSSVRIILLMGVAGSGKTTIGRRLAAELGWPYFEADDFHSEASREKMQSGVPLNDDDRAPWLVAIRAQIDACVAAGRPAVFTCSALKQKYRQVLLAGIDAAALVHLAADRAMIEARVQQRPGHFLKADLVPSQLAALEPPADALTLDAGRPPEILVAQIRRHLSV